MYPANRDEILKGLTDLVSTIRKILQAKDVEEAAQREAALAAQGQGAMDAAAQEGVATAAPRHRTAAEALFADFPDDDETVDGNEAGVAGATGDSKDVSKVQAHGEANSEAQDSAQTQEQTQIQAQVDDATPVVSATVVETTVTAVADGDCLAVQVTEESKGDEQAVADYDGEVVVQGTAGTDANNAESILAAATVGENVAATEETKFALGNENELDAEKVAQALELRFKICKHIIMQVDNGLGDFRDMLDTMQYYNDDKYEEAQKLVDELEECTTDLIAYLRSHNHY